MTSAQNAGLACKPLDGGWGWMVVIGAHISLGFAYSTPKVLSIFFTGIQEDLHTSYSAIAWITSIMLASMYGGGPLSSVMVNRFGSRPVVMLGGLMCTVSMVIASFATSIIYLYICVGVIAGLGLALNMNASLTIISKYFLAKRPLANGLAMAGSPVFLCAVAPLNQFLLNNFGWRGSFLILSALMLNCCVAGALMRPLPSTPHPPAEGERKTVEQQPINGNSQTKRGCMKTATRLFDLSCFKDRGFIIYLIGNVLFMFGAYAPIVFLPAYAITHGVDEYSAAYLLSIMGLVDMFVRPSTGVVANSKLVRPRVQYFFSFAVALNGACHLFCTLITSFPFLVVYAVFFGLSFGMVFALIFECLMDLMGGERFPSAVGLVTIIECFPLLLGPPAAALLVDIFDDYRYLYFMCGSVILAAGVFLFVMNMYNYKMLEKEKAARPPEQAPEKVERTDQAGMSMVDVQTTADEHGAPEALAETGPQAGAGAAETAQDAQGPY